MVPKAVYNEVVRYGKPGSKELKESEIKVIALTEDEKVLAKRLCDLYKIEVGEAEAIAICISRNYELFLTTHQPKPHYTVAFLDPSGTGHPMGYSIWSCDITGTFFWQKFGIEYELGERPEEWGLGEKLNHRQIQADMLEKAHQKGLSMVKSQQPREYT